MHSDGLIHLKTKIVEIDDSFSFLCPILLDSNNQAVELLIKETHETMFHSYLSTTRKILDSVNA